MRAHAVQADLRDEAQIDAALQQVQETLGPIDILVNNAGIAPVSRAERHTLDRWQQALDINLTAVFLCCQKVGQQMIARGQGGRIINISSVLGEGANAVHKTVGYAATKGAVTNMTRQLAVEWAPYGITVNALAPSWFPTEMITIPVWAACTTSSKRVWSCSHRWGGWAGKGSCWERLSFWPRLRHRT